MRDNRCFPQIPSARIACNTSKAEFPGGSKWKNTALEVGAAAIMAHCANFYFAAVACLFSPPLLRFHAIYHHVIV